MLFKSLFDCMHEMLDTIIQEYPLAESDRKQELEDQLAALKSMSDDYLEQWIIFEEKMSLMTRHTRLEEAEADEWAHKGLCTETFRRGQGYYKLFMFEQAIKEFEQLLEQYSDFLIARLYLAMGYLQKGDLDEASRHFHLIVPLTGNRKLQAISYNALGCIQAKKGNSEQAIEYFRKALELDPSYEDPSTNLQLCGKDHEALKFGIAVM